MSSTTDKLDLAFAILGSVMKALPKLVEVFQKSGKDPDFIDWVKLAAPSAEQIEARVDAEG